MQCMINKENFKFIRQSQEPIYQNLSVIFNEYVDESIIIGWFDGKSDYKEANMTLLQTNAKSKYFVVKYRIHDKLHYKVILFKYIDLESIETLNENEFSKIHLPYLKFKLLVNFNEIKG